MKDSIKINWKKGMAFEAEVDEYKIMMDAKKEHGGKGAGPRPKPLSMVSLAGCTGMDVVSILGKMRVELDDFSIVVEGDLADEHPKLFISLKEIISLTINCKKPLNFRRNDIAESVHRTVRLWKSPTKSNCFDPYS